MNRKVILTLTIIILVIIQISVQNNSLFPVNQYTIKSVEEKPSLSVDGITTYTERGPIEILNDSAFDLYGFSGSGIPNDPYLIDGYNITSNFSRLVHIENTTNHFRINNSILNLLGADSIGIYMKNVSHCIIENNTIFNTNGFCIYLESSNDSSVSSNILYSCYEGIQMTGCFNNKISDNEIYNSSSTGIRVTNGCHNNTLMDNTIYDIDERGITIEQTSAINTVKSNTIYNCSDDGIGIIGGTYNNTVLNNTIYNCSARGIGTYEGAFNNTIKVNTIYNCSSEGIGVFSSESITVFGNFIQNCSNNGISIDYSDKTIVWENTIYNCSGHGIEVYRSNRNTISFNIFYKNIGYGLLILHEGSFSDNNIVTMNNFVNNNEGYQIIAERPSQAYAEHHLEENTINSNYWSDWSGSGNYSIDGLGYYYNDTSALVNPVPPTLTIVSPIAQEYETDTINIILSRRSTIRHFWYFIEGIDNQNQTWSAIKNRLLPDGTYTLHVYGRDILSSTVKDSVTFSIDAYLPTAVITSPSNTTYTHTSVPLIYTATDYQTLTIYLNGLANTTAVPTGSVVSDFPDVSDIPDGSYNITIIAKDQANNIAKDFILFTIDTTTTTTSTEPSTTTTSTATPTTTTERTTSKQGSFPEISYFLIFLSIFVVYYRKRKKI